MKDTSTNSAELQKILRERKEVKDSAKVGAEARAHIEESLKRIGYTSANDTFLERMERFAAALAFWGGKANLTARPNDPIETAFHIVDSLMPLVVAATPQGARLAGAFGQGKRVLDIGSGAGFPGVVLAAGSEAHFTLTEPRRKRASFLAVLIAELGLSNTTIDPAQQKEESPAPAEASGPAPAFDLVMTRALGKPSMFYRIAGLPLKSGGIAMLYANPAQRLELEAATAAGLGDYARIEYEVPRGAGSVKRALAVWQRR